MKIVLFSSVHLRDQSHANSLAGELADWDARAYTAFDHKPDMFLVERSDKTCQCPIDCEIIYAGIPDSKPYHAKDWSYGVAAFHAGLHYAMQRPFDVLVHLFTDAILGVPLEDICREFTDRPETMAGPVWGNRPDTHLILMKRQAVIDILYSIPFVPLCKTSGNALYYEDAISLIFADKFWNPWPDIMTIRQEINTPEIYKGTDEETIKSWPLLTNASPQLMAAYRQVHPTPLT